MRHLFTQNRFAWTIFAASAVVFVYAARRSDVTESVRARSAPARLAASGQQISAPLGVRNEPIRLKPSGDFSHLVSDEQLCIALSSALPHWHPPVIPALYHELLLWGPRAHFSTEINGLVWDGRETTQIILSDSLCRDRTVQLGGSYLLDSPFGIRVVGLGSADAEDARGEAHFGQLLKVLAQSGIPLNTPVTTESGRVGTVEDMLRDALFRFSVVRENEFMAIPVALWIPPSKSWTDQFDVVHTFDELIESLIAQPVEESACAGCHIPYAVAVILHVDGEHQILAPSGRRKAMEWLASISAKLAERQLIASGSWDGAWSGTGVNSQKLAMLYGGSEFLARIAVTGHHLEWMAIAPEEVIPASAVIRFAICGLIEDIKSLPPWEKQPFKTVLPCAHAARSLCLLRNVDPFEVWCRFRDSGRLVAVSNGYRLSPIADQPD